MPQSPTKAVSGWIKISPDHWRSVLRCWLDTRKRLWREFGIPITEKLHTTAYVNGRGRISKSISGRHVHDGHEYWKDFGREVAHERLEALRCAEGLSLGAIYRRGKPGNLAQIKRELYAELATRVEHELLEFDSLAMIFMDGDGADGSCRTARRGLALAERRVIEDAIHIDSAGSQLIQMADLSRGAPTPQSTATRKMCSPLSGPTTTCPNVTPT